MWIITLSEMEITSQLIRKEIFRLDKVLERNRKTTINMYEYLTKEINSINRQLYELEMRGSPTF